MAEGRITWNRTTHPEAHLSFVTVSCDDSTVVAWCNDPKLENAMSLKRRCSFVFTWRWEVTERPSDIHWSCRTHLPWHSANPNCQVWDHELKWVPVCQVAKVQLTIMLPTFIVVTKEQNKHSQESSPRGTVAGKTKVPLLRFENRYNFKVTCGNLGGQFGAPGTLSQHWHLG